VVDAAAAGVPTRRAVAWGGAVEAVAAAVAAAAVAGSRGAAEGEEERSLAAIGVWMMLEDRILGPGRRRMGICITIISSG
jgi:hypothetical protein